MANINDYYDSAFEVSELVRKGRKYLKKLAALDLEGAFIYLNPKTCEYSLAVHGTDKLQKQAYYKNELYKGGSLMFTRFDDNNSEENGWLPILYPEGYSPLRKLKKYAAFIDTPAKLSLAGALIGGSVGGLKSLVLDSLIGEDEFGDPLSWNYRWKHALTSMGIGAGIGTIPGALVGLAHSQSTKPLLGTNEKGRTVYGKPEVGFWRSMFLNPTGLRKKSPTYAAKARYATASQDAFGKQGSLFGNVSDIPSDVINVDSFNRVIWDDTKNGVIQPDNALLVSSALEASKGHGPLVTPGAVIGTLVNAGIGYATAGVIGKTLGAMGMCSPESQATLRQIGTWGGMINGLGNMMMH